MSSPVTDVSAARAAPPTAGAVPSAAAAASDDFVLLTSAPLESYNPSALVCSPSAGAISSFIGTTRDSFEGKRVVRLEYEAYAAMATKQMGDLCRGIRARWPNVSKIAILHRTGVVLVCEASVVIAVSSPHRRESLEAVSWCIDELKRTLCVWKKEQYDDGSVWKQNAEFDAEALTKNSSADAEQTQTQQ